MQYYRFIECISVACGRLQWESSCSVITEGFSFLGKGRRWGWWLFTVKAQSKLRLWVIFREVGLEDDNNLQRNQAQLPVLSVQRFSLVIHSANTRVLTYLKHDIEPDRWQSSVKWTKGTWFLLAALFRQEKNPVSFFNVINNEVGFLPSAAVWWY